ncbi:hypothetical protein OIU93_07305 [Paeniglutamicibacter sp. ZC-3]|uniref:hypothetical protein n=1 Tax=Paeniglutamicibacter sp. ZC-3 TaxID=2986919 RepID=UPI0021F7E0B7|nr:hypothetical protein [Paeniglutamicibacter sp. ZC-3]MCV9994106.1 hypothetical protein [Paeniglutamicibacter sp. ZC-3]
MNVNTISGLKEEHHDYYGLPLVHQRGLNSLRFTGQRTAVHTVPLQNGKTLDFYASLGASDELFVGFHGANSLSRNFYPRFERVQSLKQLVPAFIAFADPTLLISSNREMHLSWFLGGPGWDPLLDVKKVIKKAIGKCGAKHVAFIGGSGGGFAALRASSWFPGSMAFVQEPQTVIADYIPSVVDKYFRTVWPEWIQESLLESFPERFNMVEHYRQANPENFVYYTQSIADPFHVEKHFEPFCAAMGIGSHGGDGPAGNRVMKLYEGEVQGHGKLTSQEFNSFFTDSLARWREQR